MRRASALLVLTLLAACGGYDGPKVGEVVGHQYDDPDEWWTTTVVGKVPVMTQHTDEAHWFLVLDDGEKRDAWEVSRATYEAVENGQWFNTETGEVELR